MSAPKKVVLAYSGGLDTSIILKWLQTEYGYEVVTINADMGQGEELEPARKKAEILGVSEIFIEDLHEEFVRDFVFTMFRANALYEGLYLLGTEFPANASRHWQIPHGSSRLLDLLSCIYPCSSVSQSVSQSVSAAAGETIAVREPLAD